ncbi:unnamed protein product [Dibothriocephalus latus]|uniref:Glucosidase II beta subunit N-terminal domain-containing protein n=1 Tax=Dibothriocephalus latus TaxID=60516 RepID=A0A3P6U3L7_DIBLA|nr:unnamed protein product [Dibothriocephalus latus]
MEVFVPHRLTFHLCSTSPLLLTLLLLHTFDSSTTVSTRSGAILTSSPRRTRDTSGEEEETSVSEILLDSTFCLDSLGVKRGLFTRWIDPLGCECSCNPTGKFAVIICDESCSGASTGSESRTLEHVLELPDINQDKGNQKCEVVLRFWYFQSLFIYSANNFIVKYFKFS